MPVHDDGEYLHGTEQEWEFKSRTSIAQIKGVNEHDGKLTIELIGSRERYVVDVPVQGFSINGISSAWQRYMPTEREFVDVTFDARNRPRVVGISTYPGTDDAGAYARVAKGSDDNTGNLGLIFRKISRGEFDLRSSGGAGYYFTKSGHALIQAGPTFLDLDKTRFESFGNAGLWVRKGPGIELRFGDVKRLLPATFDEASVGVMPGQLPPNPTVAGAVEWKRTLSFLTPPAGVPVLNVEIEEVGDVRDDLGIPVPGPFGIPLRYRRQLFDATGLAACLKIEVDAVGNVQVTQGSLAVPGGMVITGGPLAPLKTSFFSQEHTATTTYTVKATTMAHIEGTVGLELTSGGLPAAHPMVYGDLLLTAFNSHIHATAFGPTIGPPVPLLLGPGVDMSATTKVG